MAKILLVLDGGYRFSENTGIPDFTYIALVSALTAAGHHVTKAHRQNDGSADHQSFNFATTLNLLDFDVLWMIGKDGRNDPNSVGTSGAGISESEIAAIARFMDAGGGVFATGDHDSIGAEMCGHIPRVRAMRAWYGANDTATPMPADFPRNHPSITAARADTTQRNPAGSYADNSFVWFENQSDSVPQPITPVTSPAHPILRRNGADIVIYPDHMHEGRTLGEVATYSYDQTLTFDGESFVEFPLVDGNRQMPEVIASGQTTPYASKYVASNSFVGSNSAASGPQEVASLSVYDGRAVGVGRIVTGSTFHHYVDINLTGDSGVNTPALQALTGPDAAKGHGFGHPGAESTFDAIKAVFDNIANWLARPRPQITLVLERSVFSQAEAAADADFDGAFLVIVDGLKPNQFPGGGITTLSPSSGQLAGWAPSLTLADNTGLVITPTGVASDDPALEDRLQRITFSYRFTVNAPAFGFGGDFRNIAISASLTSPAAANPLTDAGTVQLTKSANPFMLDLDYPDAKPWLSSDLRVFPVIAGAPGSGLVNNASRAQAIDFLRDLIDDMSVSDFEALDVGQSESALSSLPTATGSGRKVYNFAVARVRLPSAGASADDVRVFFRIFTSQTTAALTYAESPAGTPIGGYKRTMGADPIALPGTNASGSEWLSFPMFSNTRNANPENQDDPDNIKDDLAPGSSTFYGCLIDNNLNDAYLKPTPNSSDPAVDLPTLMMNEHQCIVAQIEFAGTPIPNGSTPFTSDKLAQRNLALSAIANPGLDASRVALTTFELEASPRPVAEGFPPDELLLDWLGDPPAGTEVRLYVPTWNARDVVDLADRFYARHEIRVIDDHTIALPGGGTRYVPVPRGYVRPTGVLSTHFPLGVVKGQRYNLAVRQITTRGRRVPGDRPKARKLSLAEATRLLKAQGVETGPARRGATAAAAGVPKGAFNLDERTVLITDLRLLDDEGDHAVLIEHPQPIGDVAGAAAQDRASDWRETIGAFQLGVPVQVKADMLAHHLRLLSVLRWRAEALKPNQRWYATFIRYVELIAEKVKALGGNPHDVPATPDGDIPWPGRDDDGDGYPDDFPGEDDDNGGGAGVDDPFFEPGDDDWLGETDGLPDPDLAKAGIYSGKVSGLIFDHFGDFEGFTVEAYSGAHYRFFSREAAIHDHARTAWLQRYVVTVMTVSAHSREVRRILLRGYTD